MKVWAERVPRANEGGCSSMVSLMIIVGLVVVGGLVAFIAFYAMRGDGARTVTLIADFPEENRVETRECVVEDRCALWETEDDEDPLPIRLDPSKARMVDGQPGYYVCMDHGDVYVPDFSDAETWDVPADRIDARILRNEQMSTTIQDIADAADSRLQAMAKLMPWAAGVTIFLLIAIIVIVMR